MAANSPPTDAVVQPHTAGEPAGATSIPIPNALGVTLGCKANTAVVALKLPSGDTPGAVSRMAVKGDDLLLIADGGLYSQVRQDLHAGAPAQLDPLILPRQVIGGRPVQELTDLDVESGSGLIATLDKAGHVFGYDLTSGKPRLLFRATRALEERLFSPFQFVAVTFDSNGRLLLLDTTSRSIWEVVDENNLHRTIKSEDLATAIDFTTVGDSLYTLQVSGSIRVSNAQGEMVKWRDPDDRLLGLSLRTSNHLGAPLIYVSDGLRRSITGFMPDGGLVTRHEFEMPDRGLLRDYVYADEKLYAVSDGDLWIYPSTPEDGSSSLCANSAGTQPLLPDLYGFDLFQSLSDAQTPLVSPTLPYSPHSYPGASRTYRLGVHNGTDFYGYAIGTPVAAVAPGVVVEATLDYLGMTYDDFLRLAGDSERLGLTPPDALSRFEGRKVAIYHGNSITTVYAHLDSIVEGIVPGAQVAAGQIIGTVGVTGTSAESRPGTEDPHLHLEVWLGNRYLGDGITIREAMWWIAQLLPTSQLDLP